MSCAEALKYLHEFLDKELGETLGLVINNHIHNCEECHQRYEFERGLRAVVKAHCIKTHAPAHLHDRIIKNLTSLSINNTEHQDKVLIYKPKVIRPSFSFRLYPIAASILLSIIGGVFYYTHYYNDSSLSVVNNAVRNHVVAVNDNLVFNETTSIVGNINKYLGNTLQAKLGNSPTPINTEQISIMGGIPAKPYGTSSSCTVFDRGCNKLSLQVIGNDRFPTKNLERVLLGNKEFFLGNLRGFNSVLWKEAGLTYCLTSDMEKNELLKFAATLDYH